MSRPSPRQAAFGALAGLAVVSARALTRPARTDERSLLDWELVRRVARQRSGERPPTPTSLMAAQLGREYDEVAAEMAPLMASVVETPVSGYPPFSVLDRHGFIDRNLVIAQRMLAPVEKLRAQIPESRATALSRVLLSRYVGELFGFISQRVLGQYDPVLMLAPGAVDGERDASALYLVEPNVEMFEAKQGVGGPTLRRWLVLHELTHAWQFEAHPWLREHLGAMMSELLMDELVGRLSGGDSAASSRSSTVDMLRTLPSTLRTQLRTVGRVQAVMSVCEGYSNYVMHQVGSRHLADFEKLEAAFHARSARRSPLERVVFKVTGLSMKMRQYEMGERFAERVVERGGLSLLNRVWEAPEFMPTLAELENPQRWVARVSA